jgi:aspartyl-tRNA(Asn)/glutamyl-tRNA(Gln) amidotransferase subunit C
MITEEEVLHIAKLAKLKLTNEEVQLFKEQLGRILEYFKKINELNTEDVEPMKHVIETQNVLREDKPQPPISQKEALKNAPKKKEGFFEVPKVF